MELIPLLGEKSTVFPGLSFKNLRLHGWLFGLSIAAGITFAALLRHGFSFGPWWQLVGLA